MEPRHSWHGIFFPGFLWRLRRPKPPARLRILDEVTLDLEFLWSGHFTWIRQRGLSPLREWSKIPFHLCGLFELDYIPELFETLDLDFNYVSLLQVLLLEVTDSARRSRHNHRARSQRRSLSQMVY